MINWSAAADVLVRLAVGRGGGLALVGRGAGFKNISDETSRCCHFASIGSIVANLSTKSIPIDQGNTLYLVEFDLNRFRGPDFFFLIEGKYKKRYL